MSDITQYLEKLITYYENTIRDFIEVDDVVEILKEIKNKIKEKGAIHE